MKTKTNKSKNQKLVKHAQQTLDLLKEAHNCLATLKKDHYLLSSIQEMVFKIEGKKNFINGALVIPYL